MEDLTGDDINLRLETMCISAMLAEFVYAIVRSRLPGSTLVQCPWSIILLVNIHHVYNNCSFCYAGEPRLHEAQPQGENTSH